MVSFERSGGLPPISAEEIVHRFYSERPIYPIPTDIVDGEVKEWQYVVYDASTAAYDALVDAGYNPADNVGLPQRLAKVAERQIPDLEQILKQRQELADQFNNLIGQQSA